MSNSETRTLHATIERCARIAETEPEPKGEMPDDLRFASMEDVARAAIRATKKNIAARIRGLK